jgi:hypothetical protein
MVSMVIISPRLDANEIFHIRVAATLLYLINVINHYHSSLNGNYYFVQISFVFKQI